MNSFDKKMLLLFQNKISLYRKTVNEMTYIDKHKDIILPVANISLYLHDTAEVM